MAEKHKHLDDAKQDELGRLLDAALAKYAAVEPRQGLEERVLANLRAERARVPDRAWWQWSVIAAVAAVLVVALALAWRSGQPSHPLAASHPSAPTQAPSEPATQVVSNREGNGVRPSAPNRPRRIAHRALPAVMASAQPKLDQFPSPQPLSEQELALVRYASQFPQEATLIARAQEEYEQEIQRMMKDALSETRLSHSDQQER